MALLVAEGDTPAERLLENADGSVFARGDSLLVCDCQGLGFDLGVRLITTFALTVATILTTLVALRAVPWPLLLVSSTWVIGAVSALVFTFRRRRRHGVYHFDFDRGELRQQGRGFQRTIPLGEIQAVTTLSTNAIERDEAEKGMEPLWLVLCLANGERLRLGKGPGYALRPVLAWLRRAGVPIR